MAMNARKTYLVSQTFSLLALFAIASQIRPYRLPLSASSVVQGSHAGMDAICIVALIGFVLSLLPVEGIRWRSKLVFGMIWFLLMISTNPILR